MIGAFIYMSRGCSPKEQNAELPCGVDNTLVYGVSTVDEGIEVAKQIVNDKGVEIIELCGGFGEEGARRVREALGDKILVGYVVYFEEDSELIEDIVSRLS